MNPILIGVLRALLLVIVMLTNVVWLILMLRKVLGHLHLRFGPMELGPHGAFQTIADVFKILTKEITTPKHVDKGLFLVAPLMILTPAIMTWAAIPFTEKMVAADLDMGLLYVFAIATIAPLGIMAAGWSSHNKWGTIGAMRSVASVVSYEVPRLLAALPVVMMAGSLNLTEIVRGQQDFMWYIIPAFPAFLVFLISTLMEGNATPFDMSEAESELISGYANEYSGMRFGLMYVAEFSNMFTLSAVVVLLFFGGWALPFVPNGWWSPLIFVLKVYVMIFVMMWVRGTLPRVRIDQLLSLGWKVLIPVSLVWILITGAAMKFIPLLVGGGA